MSSLEKRSVRERIPDLRVALDCLKAVAKKYPYNPTEERLFREDVQYSFKMFEDVVASFEEVEKQKGIKIVSDRIRNLKKDMRHD
jgi:hypothetical protein